MGHYKSNLRDIEFNLFEVLGRDDVLGTGPFAEVDGETAREILAEVDRMARDDLAASFEEADRNPPVFDPETHTAPLPESFKKSYRAWMDAEYWRLRHHGRARRHARALQHGVGDGRDGARRQPRDLDVRRRARCSPACSTATATSATRRSPSSSSTSGWGTTMVLTEPDAGLRRRRRPHQGHPERRRHLEHRGRQAVHHLGRERPQRQHHPHGAGAPGRASRAPAARAPRGSRCSSSRSSTSTSRPAS